MKAESAQMLKNLHAVITSSAVRAALERWRDALRADYVRLQKIPPSDLGLSLLGRLRTGALEEIFWRAIAPKLEQPLVVAATDFAGAVLAHLQAHDKDVNAAYEKFVHSLISAIAPQHSKAFPVLTSGIRLETHIGYPVEPGEPGTELGPLRVWSRSDWTVNIVGMLPASHRLPQWDVYAQIEGLCSASALKAAEIEMQRLLPSVFKSFRLLSEECEYLDAWDTDPELRVEFAPVPTCLTAYFARSAKKDSIERRIQNAVRLLVHADEQSNTAVALALCVAAAEALLGKKGPELASLLGDNVAALLEPKPEYRADAAEFVKRLYGLRSDVLHGTRIEKDREALDQSRLLAAATLKAVLERREFVRKSGFDPESPDELLKELRLGRFRPGQATGVSESVAVTLWRPPDGG